MLSTILVVLGWSLGCIAAYTALALWRERRGLRLPDHEDAPPPSLRQVIQMSEARIRINGVPYSEAEVQAWLPPTFSGKAVKGFGKRAAQR